MNAESGSAGGIGHCTLFCLPQDLIDRLALINFFPDKLLLPSLGKRLLTEGTIHSTLGMRCLCPTYYSTG